MKPKKIQIFVVKKGSPVFQALIKMCKQGVKDGMILDLDENEFESFKEDFILLEIDKKGE